MKDKKLYNVIIREDEFLKLSPSGNPRARVWIETETGERFRMTTATDAACCYGISNYFPRWRREYKEIDGQTWYREFEEVPRRAYIAYHETKSGALIITYIWEHKEPAA